MAGFDILALAVMGLAIVFGLVKGFFHQLLKTAAVAGAYLILYFFMPGIANFLSGTLKIPPDVAPYATVVGVVFILFIAATVLMHIFRRPLGRLKFGGLDKFIGGLLGAVKGAGLLAAITFALVSFPDSAAPSHKSRVDFMKTRVFNNSYAAPKMVVGMGYARPIFQQPKGAAPQFFIEAEDMGITQK